MNNLTYTIELVKINVNLSNYSQAPAKTQTRPWDFGEITLLILLIFGTVGNTMSVFVLQSKRLKTSNAALFLTCVAISDILFLLFKFIANMMKLYRISIFDFCVFMQVIPQAALFISVWLIIIISAERAIAVIKPLKVKLIFSRTRSKIIILFVVVFFLLLSSSIILCVTHSPAQPYFCQIKGQPNGACFVYYKLVFPVIKSVFGCFLPIIIGITLNSVIIKTLREASNKRETFGYSYSTSSLRNTNRNSSVVDFNKRKSITLDLRKKSSLKLDDPNPKLFKKENSSISLSVRKMSFNYNYSKEKKITIILLTISISFIVFTLPYSVFELFRNFGMDYKWVKNRNVMRRLMFLVDLNHATNFIFYYLTAKGFRKKFFMKNSTLSM